MKKEVKVEIYEVDEQMKESIREITLLLNNDEEEILDLELSGNLPYCAEFEAKDYDRPMSMQVIRRI